MKRINIDLGVSFVPREISLRFRCSTEEFPTESIQFAFSSDNFTFSRPENVSMFLSDASTRVVNFRFDQNFPSDSTFRFVEISSNQTDRFLSICGLEIYGELSSLFDLRTSSERRKFSFSATKNRFDFFLQETEFLRSKSTREENRQRSASSRSTPSFQHSMSTSALGSHNKIPPTLFKKIQQLSTKTEQKTNNFLDNALLEQILLLHGSIPENLLQGLTVLFHFVFEENRVWSHLSAQL